VIDLRTFESDGSWAVLREGALARSCVAATLDGLG
jgi:L-threonylcarbamoyladenylate synthase